MLIAGGLCGGAFIDDAFESLCKSRLGLRWNKISPNGVRDIMKKEWEYGIKPQFKLKNEFMDEYRVRIPAEAFQESGLDDHSRSPIIKAGVIHFTR